MAELLTEINDACDNNLDLKNFKVSQLKEYLRAYGQNVSGVKSDLIDRIKGVRRLGLETIECVQMRDNAVYDERRVRKMITPLGEILPNPNELNENSWTEEFSNIPDFTEEKDIYNYVVLKMNCKRHLKSKVFYEDRHIHNVKMHTLDEKFSHYFVKCNVLPSFPTTNAKESPEYNVWVMMSKITGNINSAECSCVAGQGEVCNHIAALLYAIADISSKKKDGTLAATSKQRKWGNPRKRKLSPKKADEITFKKVKWGKTEMENVTKGKKPVSTFSPKTDIQRLREKLGRVNLSVGWLQNFPSEHRSAPEPVIPKLPELPAPDFQFLDNQDLKSTECKLVFEEYFKSLNVDQEQCETIECLTRDQAESEDWHNARRNRITASKFGQVTKRKESIPPDNLLKEVMGYQNFENRYVRWGRMHEPAARRSYYNRMKKEHLGITVRKCGLVVNPEYPHLGSSPDGFIYCGHCKEDSQGLLEIKCPAADKWRMCPPAECAKDPDFFCCLKDDGNIMLKKTHNYYYQVQGQMGIAKRPWCDFVVWTCGGMSVERIYFDVGFWTNMCLKLNNFYLNAVLPEIFSSRVLRGKKL